MSSRRGYPIIGGPLDGRLAREADFHQEMIAQRDYIGYRKGDVVRAGGQFYDYREQYVGFNRASSYGPGGAPPTRIWLHKGLLP